jgi:hypothetical protein
MVPSLPEQQQPRVTMTASAVTVASARAMDKLRFMRLPSWCLPSGCNLADGTPKRRQGVELAKPPAPAARHRAQADAAFTHPAAIAVQRTTVPSIFAARTDRR